MLLLLVAALSASPTQAIDDLMSRYAALQRFSGAVLVARDGKVVHARAYGLANREHGVPNAVDTRFMIGSLAKQFTAAAILKLESEGQLSVGDPIVKHLPDYPRPQGEKVTIHHLLSHSSGIPSFGRRGDGLEKLDQEESKAVTLDEIIAHSRGLDLLVEPGARYRYSNTGYAILAAIVERVSGKPFETYLREALFVPAELKGTGVLGAGEVVPHLADGYSGFSPDLRRAKYMHPSWLVGSGNAFSTVRDLHAWSLALQGDAILPAAQRAKFFAAHIPRSGEKRHYAYGWFIDEIDGRHVVSHGGTTEGYVCEMYLLPNERITVIVLSNHLVKLGVHVPGEIADSTVRILMGEKADVPPMPVALTPRHRSLAGDYDLGGGRRVRLRTEGGQMIATALGDQPWTLFTSKTTAAVDRNDPAVLRAFEFVDRLRDAKYDEVIGSLAPDWRARAKPESFQKAWEGLVASHGPLSAVVPFELQKRDRFDVVNLLMRFERHDAHMEVVMTKEGHIAGWWENSDVPQREVVLIPSSDGRFFADGFRYRMSDVFVSVAGGAMMIE